MTIGSITKYYKISWNDLPPQLQSSCEAEQLLLLLFFTYCWCCGRVVIIIIIFFKYCWCCGRVVIIIIIFKIPPVV